MAFTTNLTDNQLLVIHANFLVCPAQEKSSGLGSTHFKPKKFPNVPAASIEEGGIALFLLGYQVVLGVKGARADPRVLRQT